MDEPWDDVRATADWIEQLRRRYRPDVIHMNTFAPVHAPDVPVLLTVHSCVLSWWRAVHGTDAPPPWDRYARLARAALDRAALIATPTHALLDALAAVHGPLADACVIPNGRSVAVQARAERERLVVAAGRLWDEAKNAALLARAEPAIHGRIELLGPGTAAGEVSERDVLGWFSRAAVFAEPARYEPFGLAALEAALCGCALVLGDIPSLREVWGDTARYVSPDDPHELAAAVNALLDDPARAARGARARAARYTPAAMARAYLTAYQTVASAAVAA
jgi:glycosyltransferase involved in cell wall biosynthesis